MEIRKDWTFSRRLPTLGSLLLIAAFGPVVQADEPSTSPGFDGPRTLVIGKISDNPRVDFQGLTPLVEYVVARLDDVNVTEGRVLVARDHRQMLSYMRQGKVDWVTETLGSALMLEHRAGGHILARRWKYGESDYRSTIFVRRDSSIASLADLRGHTIAFEHPGSTTGFMIPAVDMRRAGLDLVLMASPRERPPPHMVGYIFSGDEINTSSWVHRRLVDAGANSNTDWERDDQVPPAFRDDLRIVHTGAPLPRAVEVFREGLDPQIRTRLLEVLLSAHEDERGREVLRAFQDTARFDRFDETDWPYLDGLWEDLDRVLSEVN